MKPITFLFILLLSMVALASEPTIPVWEYYGEEPPPEIPDQQYVPQMWDPSGGGITGRFQLETARGDTFMLVWTVTSSEPAFGYPYHYGNVIGVNDTIKLNIIFINRSSSNIYIGNQNPETWIYPVLYDPQADVLNSLMLADTNLFDYRFEHWVNLRGNRIIEQPDTIFSVTLDRRNPQVAMVFSVWGVYPGFYRIILKPTANLPTGVAVFIARYNNVFHAIQGQSVLDTINTYCKTAIEAMYRLEYSLASTYIDSIFYLNPHSIPGWTLRFHLHANQFDTLNALASIDSLLGVIGSNLDPMYPDSSSVTEIDRLWLEDYISIYTFRKWRMNNPNTARYYRFWR